MSIHARTRLVKVPDGHIGRSQFQRRVRRFKRLRKLLHHIVIGDALQRSNICIGIDGGFFAALKV